MLSLLFIKQFPSDLYVEFSSLTCMFSRLGQSLKAEFPMLVTLSPIIKFFKFVCIDVALHLQDLCSL